MKRLLRTTRRSRWPSCGRTPFVGRGSLTVRNNVVVNATAISNLSEVTIASADHLMIFDATDNTLKKGLASDLVEQLTNEQTLFERTDSRAEITWLGP